jgi:glycerol transport system ATP-binding protein
MNVLPCSIDNGRPVFHGHALATDNPVDVALSGKLEVGVRPEFVAFAEQGIPVAVDKVEDLGRYQVVTVSHESSVIKMIVGEGKPIPSESPKISFDPAHTRIYRDDWAVEGKPA